MFLIVNALVWQQKLNCTKIMASSSKLGMYQGQDAAKEI